MIKITNIQAARTIGALLILLSGNAFADTYATTKALAAEATTRANADTAQSRTIAAEQERAKAAEAAGAKVSATKVALDAETARALGVEKTINDAITKEVGDRANAIKAIPTSHSAPVFVDANGNYIGTLLNRTSADISSNCQLSDPPTCSYLVDLILPGDYFVTMSDSGELYQGDISVAVWDNSSCSGQANLTTVGIAPRGMGSIFSSSTLNITPSSPPEYHSVYNRKTGESRMVQTATDIESIELYYLPNDAVLYNGTAYTWGNVLNPTTTYYDLVCQEVAGDYYKLTPNDPAVTGYDPVYINTLQKPFRISIK